MISDCTTYRSVNPHGLSCLLYVDSDNACSTKISKLLLGLQEAFTLLLRGVCLVSSLLFLLSILYPAVAQPLGLDVHPDFLIKQWTVEDGLPVNHINDLLQRRDGYLWMATFDGLVRFDGQRFTVFNTANSPGLTSNRFTQLYEDKTGALWLVSESGAVSRYADGVFTTFTREQGLPGPVNGFYQDADTLWLTTGLGSVRYQDGTLQPYRPDLIDEPVSAMLRDRGGSLWILGQRALHRILPDGSHRRFTETDGLTRSAAGLIENDKPGVFFEDRDGTLWLGNTSGLARLQGDRFEHLLPNAPFWQDSHPTTIEHDAAGTLWVGTSCCGWFAYRDGRLEAFRGAALDPAKTDFASMKLVLGPNGDVWRTQGAWLYRNEQPVFRLDKPEIQFFRAFILDREGNLWIGQDGLYRIRPRLIRVLSTAEGLPGPNVYPVVEAHDGTIWIGTWATEGLTRLRDETLTPFRLFSHDNRLQDLLSALFEDRAGTLWVGTLGALCRMQADRCVPVELPVPEAFTRHVSALQEDRQGRFWIGSEVGLAVGPTGSNGQSWLVYPLDHAIRTLVEIDTGDMLLGSMGGGLGRYRSDGIIEWLTTADGLASNHLRDIYEDETGVLWIATQDRGLCRLNRKGHASLLGGDLRCLSVEEGLFDNSLNRILADDYGRLWMSTNRGIFWVEHAELEAFARDEVSSITSVSYTERDGMRNRETNGARQPAGMKAADGRLWFPTQDGVVIIDPAQVQRPTAPKVVIEAVTVGDRTQRAGGTLSLVAGQRDVDIRYTALAFSRPEDVRFRYRLEGYDEDWKEAGDSRRATYTNLPPGRYTFRVKAGLGGAWSQVGASMTLDRVPFFWQTKWFYGLVALLIALSGVSIYGYRVQRLKASKEALERTVVARTAQIRAQKAQLEQQAKDLRRANKLKSHFLANVSHEFRTPLTLTFGPLSDLLGGRYRSIDEARPLLERAQRNGHRLLRLINQLLDLSKLDAGALSLQPQQLDLVAFLRQRVAAFESLALERGLTLQFVPDTAWLPFCFDAEKLETILLNLLSNAFKYTLKGGTILVTVRSDEVGDALLTVRDTGIGIPSEHLPHLFDRFYQVDASATRAREGTGIGLALVKRLVELHGGDLTVTSEVGAGTTLAITLPALTETLMAADGAISTETDRPAAILAGVASPDAEAELFDLHTRLPAPCPAEEIDETATVVLLVEDSADMRAYLRAHLDGLYHVEEAENGVAGLERALALVPDLVLSDVMMPEMDGYALLAALKADNRTSHVPVVLLTAKADAKSKLTGLKAGADDYLAKPFDAEELRTRVHNLIEGRRRLRALWSRRILTPAAVEIPSMESAFLDRVQAAIEANMAEVSFGVDALAAEVGMSARQLRRKLRSLIGEAPNELIRRFRLERAASLLRHGTGNVKEIAFAVGFKSTSRFREAFREVYGVTPSIFAEEPLPFGEGNS